MSCLCLDDSRGETPPRHPAAPYRCINGSPVEFDTVDIVDCSPMLRLQRKRGGSLSCWFQLRRPLFEQIASLSRNYSVEELDAATMNAFSEVEQWWTTKEAGPHIYGLWKYNYFHREAVPGAR